MTIVPQLQEVGRFLDTALSSSSELLKVVKRIEDFVHSEGLLNLREENRLYVKSLLHNVKVYSTFRQELEPELNRIISTFDSDLLIYVLEKAGPVHNPDGLTSASNRDGDVDTGDSNLAPIRRWFLSHLDDPFPVASDLPTFVSNKSLSWEAFRQGLTNLRRRSGYTPALRHMFREDKRAMGECVRRVWNGTEEDERLRNTIQEIIKWVDGSEKNQVGEWVEKIIAKTSAVDEDGHPLNPTATKRPRLSPATIRKSEGISPPLPQPIRKNIRPPVGNRRPAPIASSKPHLALPQDHTRQESTGGLPGRTIFIPNETSMYNVNSERLQVSRYPPSSDAGSSSAFSSPRMTAARTVSTSSCNSAYSTYSATSHSTASVVSYQLPPTISSYSSTESFSYAEPPQWIDPPSQAPPPPFVFGQEVGIYEPALPVWSLEPQLPVHQTGFHWTPQQSGEEFPPQVGQEQPYVDGGMGLQVAWSTVNQLPREASQPPFELTTTKRKQAPAATSFSVRAKMQKTEIDHGWGGFRT